MNEDQNSATGTLQEITIDGARLSLILIAMIIPFYFVGDRLFHLIWAQRTPLIQLTFPWWAEALSILAAVVLHEAIHGVLFAFFAPRGFRSVTFGISMSLGAIYCHCRDPLKVKQYRCAGIAPLLIPGLLQYITGLFKGVTWFKPFGLLLTTSGLGDYMIYIT